MTDVPEDKRGLKGAKKKMNESDNKIIDKIEKLLALSGSDNENEAKSAMLKAQELMAKYKIKKEHICSQRQEEKPVLYFSAGPFRDDWINMVATVIASNFRCRCMTATRYNSGGSFRIRFYGYEEDAEICINIFNYAVKVVRKRFCVLRAIYAEARKGFGKAEKTSYALGFCHGLEKNFEEQKQQSQSFALALVTPKEVDDYVESLPGVTTEDISILEMSAENKLLRSYGYMDGKSFQNAGDKERVADGA